MNQIVTPDTEIIPGVDLLTKDLKKAAYSMTLPEARFLVDSYYAMQKGRIRAGNQVRSLTATGEPHEVLAWLGKNSNALELEVAKALDFYTKSYKLGLWVRSITGIGPVIAAGLLAHVDIEKAPTAGHIWRYAGLDPTQVWGKGQKRPWNAQLKALCWKIGQSFLKQINRESDYYGKVLMKRLAYEKAKNERGDYRAQAEAMIARVPNHAQAAIYKQGRLPDGHILARAERYAVKLFLAHFHHVAYELRFGTPPPKPYILAHGEHVHYIAPPNWPLELTKKQELLPALPRMENSANQ